MMRLAPRPGGVVESVSGDGIARSGSRWRRPRSRLPLLAILLALSGAGVANADPLAQALDQARIVTGDNDPEAALRLGQTRLAQARERADPAALMDALEYLAWVHIGRVDPAQTDPLLAEMRALAELEHQPLWLARVLHAQGVAARRQGDTRRAIDRLEAALELRREYGDLAGEIISLNALSILRRRAGQLYLALDGHKRALEVARQLGNRVDEAESLGKIGRIYVEMDDLEPALRYYREALTVIPTEALIYRAEMLTDLAGVLVDSGRLDEAQEATSEALRLAELGNNPQMLATVYSRQARLLTEQGQPAAALQAIDHSIELGRDYDGARSVLVRRLIRARILADNGRNTDAASELEALLAEARRTDDLLVERQILELQGPVLLATGQPAAAFSASQAFNAIDRQLTSSITARRIADMQATLERRQMESEVTLVARERDLQAAKLQGQRLTLALLVAAAGGLLLTALALAWRYRAVRGLNAELHRRGEALQTAALTDPLTGLGNRHALAGLQEQSPASAARGCLLLDVDHFKRVNDMHGHPVGDQVLREIARRIAAQIAPGMSALRWGGEEFLVAGSCADPDRLAGLAEALRLSIAASPLHTAGGTVSLSASIGHAWAGAGSAESWAALLRRADEALYAAKSAGRNCSRAAAPAASARVVPLGRASHGQI